MPQLQEYVADGYVNCESFRRRDVSGLSAFLGTHMRDLRRSPEHFQDLHWLQEYLRANRDVSAKCNIFKML